MPLLELGFGFRRPRGGEKARQASDEHAAAKKANEFNDAVSRLLTNVRWLRQGFKAWEDRRHYWGRSWFGSVMVAVR